MTRILAASFFTVACCLIPPKAFGEEANGSVTVTSVTPNPATKKIAVVGTVRDLGMGWAPTSVGLSAVHLGTKVWIPLSLENALAAPQDGVYGYTCSLTDVPDGNYKIIVKATLLRGGRSQFICADLQDATMTGSAAPAFTSHGTITLTANRLLNPNTTIRCSGTASAGANWQIAAGASPVIASAFPAGGGVLVTASGGAPGGAWGNLDLADLPPNCYVLATLVVEAQAGGASQVVASTILENK
jgi:hypothetical protein